MLDNISQMLSEFKRKKEINLGETKMISRKNSINLNSSNTSTQKEKKSLKKLTKMGTLLVPLNFSPIRGRKSLHSSFFQDDSSSNERSKKPRYFSPRNQENTVKKKFNSKSKFFGNLLGGVKKLERDESGNISNLDIESDNQDSSENQQKKPILSLLTPHSIIRPTSLEINFQNQIEADNMDISCLNYIVKFHLLKLK